MKNVDLSKIKSISSYRERKRLKRIIVLRIRFERHNAMLNAAVKVAPRKFVKDLNKKVNVLKSPEKINLSDNYEETILFLNNVRLVSSSLKGRFYVDLVPAKEITPAGALMLVAAFDRWKEIIPEQRLKAVSPEKWNPDVRRKLREMGFFEVLNSCCDVIDEFEADADRYLPFLTGHGSEGDQAKALRKSIESLGPELADRDALYNGLVEAMTNVKQHAYLDSEKIKRWWMSASVNVAKNKLTVMFLDHGESIPATLPRSKVWEKVRGLLAKIGADAFQNDARLIEAALTVEKSRTGDGFRGNGLREDVKGYVESHIARGKLRILSRRGKCIYEKDASGSEQMDVQRLSTPLRGSFLEWTIEEYSTYEDGNN